MNKVMISVLIMAGVTYIPRALPITLFRKRIKSKIFKSFLYYIPFSVLGAMTFPSILYSTSNIYTALAGTATALILAYFEKGLMKVALGSVITVYIVDMLLK